jgi:RimJ/RimL family protein N-acetyltransferase
MAHPYWPLFDLVIRTPRLELRPPTDEDLPALIELADRGVHDPVTMPFSVPWTDWEPDLRHRSTMQWWWRNRAEWQAEKWVLGLAAYAIDADGGRTVIGAQDVQSADFARSGVVLTGSWLGRAHQRQGLGKEMRAAVLHLAFAGLGASRAETSAWHDNAASLGVTRALGYQPNGEHVALRREVYDRQLDFVLERAAWETRRRDDIVIEGLEACRAFFG